MNKPETHPNVQKQVRFLEIEALQAGQRIDNFLFKTLKDVPKGHIYRLLRTGQIRINKGRIKPVYRLKAGDILRLPPLFHQPKSEENTVGPSKIWLERLKNSVLYEDGELLVINKPSGLAVHGGSGIHFGVIEGLRALYSDAPYLELVHRLDRDTSGCLLIAKKPAMLRYLHELLRNNQLGKYYLALMQGDWEARMSAVNVPLKKNTLKSGERLVRVDKTGKPALTHFHFKKQYPGACLVEAKLTTGRTHQIRVHAQYSEHPLAGDEKYGDAEFNQYLRSQKKLRRLFLHAYRIIFTLPDSDKKLEVIAPLPAELDSVLQQL
ncbi:23S rRNA pseudouridine(955/2504/2580) synthase RluC [Candidatus Venteria ishoeyi]|uniref:Pseudouridine synthase n=1 Tax=Candidatus Venteria ishoeyi TaxID=1899563 RepID=A0A1H6FDX7_9GAMM|nr:23S rRNA pseudouridine(955/2504/2580) synthase RluC [Candidatus Venteria ishoeyi]MDM8546676.1 23S rRNA pseudouridine(955/2504/2580) synthase RluC [Candidatus Venteria ishoeyi]SEH07611.1 Ribosomal large subunit pseudouridine synthase C [Candidatus Venteria ishoeyi]